MRRKNKQTKITALIFSLLLIGIGYAYLSANLKINGTAKISNAKWDVHFENAKVEEKSDTVTFDSNSNSNLAQGIPVIKGDNNTELEWELVLNQPGDYYYISADIVNAGDIDAEIDLDNSTLICQIGDEDIFNKSLGELSSYYDIEPFFVYSDYSTKYIEAGDYGNIKAGVFLRDDMTNEEWNTIRGKTLKLKLDMKYKQVEPPTYSEGHMKVRVDNVVVNGYSDTITVLTNSNLNSNLAPTVTNSSVRYGTSSNYSEYSEHTVDYSLIFNQPGDYYEFSANIISEENYYSTLFGEKYTISIDNGEKIDISNLNNVPEYFNYQVTTNDRVNSRSYNFLNRIETENITVRIELKDDLTPEQLSEIQGKVVNINYLLKYHKYTGEL